MSDHFLVMQITACLQVNANVLIRMYTDKELD